MTKTEAELLLYGYIRINGCIPDKNDALRIVKNEKSWKTIRQCLVELADCMPHTENDVGWVCELGEKHPERAHLYRLIYLMNEIMSTADEGLLSTEEYCNRISQVFDLPKINARLVQECYYYECNAEISLREVQRDIQLCKKLLPVIQETNGMDEIWGIDSF